MLEPLEVVWLVAAILLVGSAAAAAVVLMLLGFEGDPDSPILRRLRRAAPHLRPAALSRRKLVVVGVGVLFTVACVSLVSLYVVDSVAALVLVLAALTPLTVFLCRARGPGPRRE